MTDLRTGMYPGTFDPFTDGHGDILAAAVEMFDRLHLSFGVNAGKDPLFTLDEREALAREWIGRNLRAEAAAKVVVDRYSGLLVHHADAVGARWIVRGLRASSDFDYEFMLNGINQRQAPHVKTVFLMAPERFLFVASSTVKELCARGGDVSSYVQPFVEAAMRRKLRAAADAP